MHEGFTGLCRAVPSPGVALAAYGRRMMRVAALCVVCLLGVNPARAGLLAGATRVIVGEGQRDVSLMLVNTNDYPVIVQTWVDRGEADPQALSPFASLPPVFRLQPGARQGIRILLADAQELPGDRESAFWLNLYEIPPTSNTPAADRLALAMNTQLKIFYRPKALPSVDVAAQLRFALVQENGAWFVECDNPTPYHASFTTLEVVDADASTVPVMGEMDMMTAPFSRRRYALGGSAPAGKIVRYALVDDAGFPQRFEAALVF